MSGNKIFIGVILTLWVFSIYSNTFSGPFTFDDESNILYNPSIRELNLKNIWRYWPGRLVPFLTFAINYKLGKFDLFGYHLFNISIHLLTGILVYSLVCYIFSISELSIKTNQKEKNLFAFLATLLFLTHPIQTETVNYIFQRTTILATFFYLASILFYLEFRRKNRYTFLLLSLTSCVIAMLTKENTFTLPVMIVILESFFFTKERRRKLCLLFLPFLVVIPFLVILSKPKNFADIERLLTVKSSFYYLLTQFRVLLTYIRLLLLPLNQNLDYDYALSKSLLEAKVIISLLILTFIFTFTYKLTKKQKLISFGILWFFLTLLPESSIIPLDDLIFEHRLYIASVGFCISIAEVLYLISKRIKKEIVLAGFLLLIFIYSFTTYARNKIWQDELTLWNDVVKKSPKKARPYLNRGVAYYTRGKLNEALNDFNTALKINPYFLDAYLNRGVVFFYKNETQKAIEDFTRAIHLEPKSSLAYKNRAYVFLNTGNYEFAILDLQQASRLRPDEYEAYLNLGVAYFLSKKISEAKLSFQKAVELYPSSMGYLALAFCFREENNYREEIESYQKALRYDSRNANIYANLANAYLRLGNLDMAINYSLLALKYDNQSALAYNNLTFAFYFKKEYHLAKRYYQKAVELGLKPEIDWGSISDKKVKQSRHEKID